MTRTNKTTLCYRPVGQAELDLIEASGSTRWPPRLPDQPIFYPVTNEQYAIELTKWNVDDFGAGYVTRFAVKATYLDQFEVKCVGGSHQTEWWIPAEELETFNDNIVGQIEVVGEYRSEQ